MSFLKIIYIKISVYLCIKKLFKSLLEYYNQAKNIFEIYGVLWSIDRLKDKSQFEVPKCVYSKCVYTDVKYK